MKARQKLHFQKIFQTLEMQEHVKVVGKVCLW